MSVGDSYNKLKSLLISCVNGSKRNVPDINILKDSYKHIINSQRRLFWIDNVEKFIEILEKRDALGPNNIKILYKVFKYFNLNNDDLKYHDNLLTSTPSAQPRNINGQCLTKQTLHQAPGRRSQAEVHFTSNRQRAFKEQPKLLQDEVIKLVCSRIGHQWKTLARYLKCIQEPTIELIEEDRSIQSNDLRARMIMDEYQRNIYPPELKRRLMKALRALQRMDIHDEVEKIFLHNCRHFEEN